MTATGNEAVSIAQLKDYAANQSAGGGSRYTYEYIVLTATSTLGNWVLTRVSGTDSGVPRMSICYNENELTIESVLTTKTWMAWGVEVSSLAGKVHFLGASDLSQETYPTYVATPYTDTDAHAQTGVLSLKVTKQNDVITVSNSTLRNYKAAAYPKLKFYITED